MNRRPTGPLSSRRARGSEGLRQRVSGGLPLLAGAGVLGLVIIIAIIVLASRCGGTASASPNCSGKAPNPPQGLVYASKYCVNSTNVGRTVQFLSIPLTDRSSTHGLSLYTYDGGSWKLIEPLTVSSDGLYVGNSSVVNEPKTFAVLRSSSNLQIFGTVPRNAQVSAEAQRLMTVSVPAVLSPAPDGSITGGPVNAAPGQQLATMPEIVAETSTDAQTVNSILGSAALQSTHVDRIAAAADAGAWSGVVIDYPSVDASLKANFNSFVQALATRLHASKRQLVLRLPLPRKEGNNWNEFAYDWATLAKSVDYFIMVAEHDQSIYRTRVPDAVQYLAGQVGDSHKLVLEVTPLSEQKSETGDVTTLTTLQALSIAGQITVRDPQSAFVDSDITVSAENINRDNGSGLQWTPQGVLSFNYQVSGEQRTVWVENQFSAGFKLELIELDRLGGVSVDNASNDPSIADIWPAIDQFQSTGSPPLLQPNPQALRPQWLADGQPIPDAGNRAVITWHTPAAPGPHQLSVIVSDGVMRVANTATVNVLPLPPGGRPSPTPGAAPNLRTTPTRAPTTTGR